MNIKRKGAVVPVECNNKAGFRAEQYTPDLTLREKCICLTKF